MTLGGKAPDRFIEIKLCEQFGWTLQELYSQPADFLEELLYVKHKESEINQLYKYNDR